MSHIISRFVNFNNWIAMTLTVVVEAQQAEIQQEKLGRVLLRAEFLPTTL